MHILTFDIEDWFHILDNAETADIKQWKLLPSRLEQGVIILLDLCDKIGVKATFFILGWVAKVRPDLVKEIERRGHELGCHSYRHQLVYTQSPKEFEYDITTALENIERASGVRPNAYRAPGFSITTETNWAFDKLYKHGIEIDCSIFPAPRAHGGYPDFPVRAPCLIETEIGSVLRCFPMSYANVFGKRIVFSGGGYFRLLPFTLINAGFKYNRYTMTYFHARDFDRDQPKIPGLGVIRRFKSCVGIGTAFNKFIKVAHNTQFMSLGDASACVDWGSAERVFLTKFEEFHDV